MADSLILLSSIEYIRERGIKNSIFITSNTNDFSDNNDLTAIHDDLISLVSEVNLKYSINIGDALNKVEAEIISEETVQRVSTMVSVQDMFAAVSESMVDLSSIHALSKALVDFSAMEESIIAATVATNTPFMQAMQQIAENDKEMKKELLKTFSLVNPVHDMLDDNALLQDTLKAAMDFSKMQESLNAATDATNSTIMQAMQQIAENDKEMKKELLKTLSSLKSFQILNDGIEKEQDQNNEPDSDEENK